MTEANWQPDDKSLIIQGRQSTRIYKKNIGEQGDSDIGDPGQDAATYDFQGDWSNAASYQPGDVVLYPLANSGDGSVYICTTANSNKNPVTETGFWALFVERGPAGAQGPGGVNFRGGVNVGLWRGAWSSGQSYSADDIVRFNSSAYIAVSSHTSSSSNQPGTAGNPWQLFVKRGNRGPQGKRGPKGATGSTGPQGPRGKRGPAGTLSYKQFETNWTGSEAISLPNTSTVFTKTVDSLEFPTNHYLLFNAGWEAQSDSARILTVRLYLTKGTATSGSDYMHLVSFLPIALLSSTYSPVGAFNRGTSPSIDPFLSAVSSTSNTSPLRTTVGRSGTWNLIIRFSVTAGLASNPPGNWTGTLQRVYLNATAIPLGS